MALQHSESFYNGPLESVMAKLTGSVQFVLLSILVLKNVYGNLQKCLLKIFTFICVNAKSTSNRVEGVISIPLNFLCLALVEKKYFGFVHRNECVSKNQYFIINLYSLNNKMCSIWTFGNKNVYKFSEYLFGLYFKIQIPFLWMKKFKFLSFICITVPAVAIWIKWLVRVNIDYQDYHNIIIEFWSCFIIWYYILLSALIWKEFTPYELFTPIYTLQTSFTISDIMVKW